MSIQPGTIGVNTAADNSELLEVIGVTKNIILARPLVGGAEHLFPIESFWPLLTTFNTSSPRDRTEPMDC